MAPNLSEDEIDDLIYLARAGEDAELDQMLKELAEREKATVTQILEAARDEGKATCLHMAAANGHSNPFKPVQTPHTPFRCEINIDMYTETVTHILSYLPTTSTSKADASTSPQSADTTSNSSQTPTPSYINSGNSFGNTALHWACLGGHLDVVKLLLSRGADPTAANDKDQIPLDLAAFNNHMGVVEFFLSQSREMEGKNAGEGRLEGGVEEVDMADTEEGSKDKKEESSGS